MRLCDSFSVYAWRTLGLGLGLVLLFAIACGASATATPRPTSAPAATSAPVPTAVPAATSAPVPTAVPAATAVPPAPASAAVGKLTLMLPQLGNERWDNPLQNGAVLSYNRLQGAELAARDEDSKLIPGLASEWGLSADGLTWTWTLRKGAKFHDGKEVTAEDAFWTFQHYFGHDETRGALDIAIAGGVQRWAKNTEKVTMAGDTMSWTMVSVNSGLAAEMSEAGPTAYKIMPKGGDKYWEEQDSADYDKNPIGAGPMVLTKQVIADRMEFERFDDYYYQPANGLPEDRRMKFAELDLLLVPEESTRGAALQAGEADIVPASLEGRDQIEAGGGRLVFGREGNYLMVYTVGAWKPEFPVTDKRVRQALAYSIDKELMRDNLFGAEVFEIKGWSIVTPSSLGYTPAADPFPYDPDKARALMAEAGYPNGDNFGTLIVDTWVSASFPFMTESAQLAASFWEKELGIDVDVRIGDEADIKKRVLTEELYGHLLWRDNETRMDTAGGINYWLGDPKLDSRLHEDQSLFDQIQAAASTIDPAARSKAYNELVLRLKDESYQLSFGYVNIPWGVGPNVAEWTPFSLALYPSALHTVVLK